jgi:peptidoglycan hydrolase CwlO-like protein
MESSQAIQSAAPQGSTQPRKPGELTDIEPEEVSLVDRAANKKKFLVVKRDAEGATEMAIKMTAAKKKDLTKALAEMATRIGHLQGSVEKAEEVADEKDEQTDEMKTLMKALHEVVAPFVTEKKDPPKPKDEEAPAADAGACAKPPVKKDEAPAADVQKRLDESEAALKALTAEHAALLKGMVEKAAAAPPVDLLKRVEEVEAKVAAVEKRAPAPIEPRSGTPDSATPVQKGAHAWPSDIAEAVRRDREKKSK